MRLIIMCARNAWRMLLTSNLKQATANAMMAFMKMLLMMLVKVVILFALSVMDHLTLNVGNAFKADLLMAT